MENMDFAREQDPVADAGASTFQRAGSQARRAGSESFIDPFSSFKGSFRTSQNLRIEGGFEGDVECEGTLIIAENANVTANVKAQNLIVYGAIHGDIVCDGRLEVAASGKLSGRASAAVVTIHEGAFYEGELRMLGSNASRSAPAFGSRTAGSRRREARPEPQDVPSFSFTAAGRYPQEEEKHEEE
jgi:cytoskeletal protein CcmA (bactofilin family)